MLPHIYPTDYSMSQTYYYTIDENYPDAVNGLLMYLDGSSNNSPHSVVSPYSSLSSVGKKSFMDEFVVSGEWREKSIKEWNAKDVVQWICENAKENNYEIEEINIDEFRIDGYTLLKMSEQEFVTKDRCHGLSLFNALHAHKAVGKKSFIDGFKDCSEWREKPINKWTSADVVQWICENAKENNYDIEEIKNIDDFHIDGITLLKMSKQEFMAKDRYYGPCLFHALHAHKALEEKSLRDETEIENLQPMRPLDVIRPESDKQESAHLREYYYCSPSSDSEFDHSDYSNAEKKEPLKRKKPGRPRKTSALSRRGNKGKRCGKVWEFIRDLLLNPQYCPSFIQWEDRKAGVFRFVRSQEVASLWGKRRNEENSKMNYEKFSRAMRHNYKTNFLQPVLGRRLVYKFGSRATGWQLSNPNFTENS